MTRHGKPAVRLTMAKPDRKTEQVAGFDRMIAFGEGQRAAGRPTTSNDKIIAGKNAGRR